MHVAFSCSVENRIKKHDIMARYVNTCENREIFIENVVIYRPLVKSMYQKIFFLFLNQNICYGYSKEPSQ